MRLSIPEILESLEEKSTPERVKILKSNETKSLKQFLYSAFHPEVEFALPDSRPEGLKIKETPTGISRSNLHLQARKLKIFMKNMGYDQLSVAKRESLFVQILESVHSSEAELLLQLCVDRKLKSSLKYHEVSEAFPNLLPEAEKPAVEEVTSEPVVEEVTPEPVVYKDMNEVYAQNSPEEKKEVYKDMSEVYEKNESTKKPKSKSKSKKSSKKKSK